MKEIDLTRGCVALDIYEVISKRLNLPGSDKEFRRLGSAEVLPGLFFSQSSSLHKIIGRSEQYAVDEAERAGKMPFVITMRINEENFGCIGDRVWIPRPGSDFLSKTSFKYDPVRNFSELIGSVAVIALNKMSDDELVNVNAGVGLLLPEGSKFQYRPYKEYLGDSSFKNPSPDDFDWLKGLKG